MSHLVTRLSECNKPGLAHQDPSFPSNSLRANTPGSPGGIFDPFGWSKGDLATLKVKEIKNGRLAMLALVGFTSQVWQRGP